MPLVCKSVTKATFKQVTSKFCNYHMMWLRGEMMDLVFVCIVTLSL